ncbi:hypothetical protein HPB48_015665 [Haemaphysalis longicornis]|uniref:DDE Tnp4 domain-containing protein n=1 Tax=Haemaphysalis longicornis TaxID=44386 RepID=A0A9J6FPI9_HAELO|nr:hypothetical protein HPB48_015665 [Haemaphysalis longicornis]
MDAVRALAAELLDHSSSSDEESGSETTMLMHELSLLLYRVQRNRVPLYVETVVPRYMDFEFQRLFRLPRDAARHPIERFEASPFYPKAVHGRPRMSAEKTFLIGLRYLATQMTMNHIADKFDVAESSVQNSLNRLLDFLFSISEEVIRWPTETERERSFQAFRTMAKTKSGKQGLPNVIGCIDGCHIEIPKPAVSEHSYYNRKKYHSVLLQGICNEQKQFIDVFAGCPGSAHDARVLKKSFFYEDAAAKCEGGYLLIDSAYPLLPWLLPPYKVQTRGLAEHEEDFNRLHSQKRVTIEGAFGLLKNRFRRLSYVDELSIKQAVLIIIGSCVLHNLCIRTSDDDNSRAAQSKAGCSSSDDDSDLQPCAGYLRDEIALSL